MSVDWYRTTTGNPINQYNIQSIHDIDEQHKSLYINKITRMQPKLSQSSTRYHMSHRMFTHQYGSIYYCRLNKLRQNAINNAHAHYNHDQSIKICGKVLDLRSGEKCIIGGTLYKEMKLKPSILDELTHTNKKIDNDNMKLNQHVLQTSNVQTYINSDDTLILEDEYGRVQLQYNPNTLYNINSYVSGIVVALYGEVNDDNDRFIIDDIFYSTIPINSVTSIPKQLSSSISHQPEYILFVSGLSIGNPLNTHNSIELLIDYITGVNGSTNDQSHAAHITRVIICGNTLHRFELKKGKDFMKVELDVNELSYPLQQLDCTITQLCSTVDTHIMPGQLDPANYTLPQQPLHSTLFPSANTYNTFHSETNPIQLHVSNSSNQKLNILGCSGQNIDDMKKYTEYKAAIDLLQCTLEWCHLAPTAPDTLNCYPYESDDPFTIDEWPDIYFSANSDSYETRLYTNSRQQQSRLLMIPNYTTTQLAVLVDINTTDLNTIPIHFPTYT